MLFLHHFALVSVCYWWGAAVPLIVGRVGVEACAVCSVLLLSPRPFCFWIWLLLPELRINQSAKGLPARPFRQSESAIPSPILVLSPFAIPVKVPVSPCFQPPLLFSFLFFPFLHPFRPLDTEKPLRILVFHSEVRVNAFEAGANTARARRGAINLQS